MTIPKDFLPFINLALGFSFGYSYARYRAFKNYFGVENRIVDAIKKEGIRVCDGDRILVVKSTKKEIDQ